MLKVDFNIIRDLNIVPSISNHQKANRFIRKRPSLRSYKAMSMQISVIKIAFVKLQVLKQGDNNRLTDVHYIILICIVLSGL